MRKIILLFVVWVLLPQTHDSVTARVAQAQSISLASSTEDDIAWSPDGDYIAFASDYSGTPDIWLMRSDGSALVNLTETEGFGELNPAWSPDSRYIAYDRHNLENLTADIWIVSRDGSFATNFTDLLDLDEYFYHAYAAWSPDGNYIAFKSSNENTADIVVVDLRDLGVTNITPNIGGVPLDLTWSPDSQFILFNFLNKRTAQGLWKAAVDGSRVTRLAFGDTGHAKWLVDGDIIGFRRYEDGIGDIFLIGSDGEGLVNLTEGRFPRSVSTIWSNNGSKIAFWALGCSICAVQQDDIWVMDADATNPVNLTENSDVEPDLFTNPVWSPDGTRIAFISTHDGSADIWVISVDGGTPVNLTGGP